jgi:hypothetical protein
VHHRDGRLGHSLQRLLGLGHAGVVRLGALGVGAHLLELADVGTGGEGLATGAAYDEDLHRPVGVDLGEHTGQCLVHAQVDRVVAVRAVEHQGRDRAVGAGALDEQVL